MSDKKKTLPVGKTRLKPGKSIHSCWIKQSQDNMWTSCFMAETNAAQNKQTVLMRSTNECNLGCVSCCQNVFIVARHRLFDGSDNQFDVSPQSYTSVSGNTIPTTVLSLENPRSHTQIPATPRQSFYKASPNQEANRLESPWSVISLEIGHECFPSIIHRLSYKDLFLNDLTIIS